MGVTKREQAKITAAVVAAWEREDAYYKACAAGKAEPVVLYGDNGFRLVNRRGELLNIPVTVAGMLPLSALGEKMLRDQKLAVLARKGDTLWPLNKKARPPYPDIPVQIRGQSIEVPTAQWRKLHKVGWEIERVPVTTDMYQRAYLIERGGRRLMFGPWLLFVDADCAPIIAVMHDAGRLPPVVHLEGEPWPADDGALLQLMLLANSK